MASTQIVMLTLSCIYLEQLFRWEWICFQVSVLWTTVTNRITEKGGFKTPGVISQGMIVSRRASFLSQGKNLTYDRSIENLEQHFGASRML